MRAELCHSAGGDLRGPRFTSARPSTMTRTVLTRALVAASAALLGGCIASSSQRFGEILVVTQGDVTLEDGLKEFEVADGWAVTFERFVVNVGGVAVGTTSATSTTLGASTYVLVDHALPGPKVVIDANDVLAQSWPAFFHKESR